MKRKVLVIALSLALLASLFAFTPAVAKPDNAAPQAEKFPIVVTIFIHLPPDVTYVKEEKWCGPPVEAGGVLYPGTIQNYKAIALYDVTGGYFGDTGSMWLHINTSKNYASGVGTIQAKAVFDLGGDGTVVMAMTAHQIYVGPGGIIPWETEGQWTIVNGTGDYDGLCGQGDYAGAGGYGGIFDGMAHFAPK
jgi:hypothetical protein